ncbi:hypothetical protein M0802_012130 [Mischocyttarus mexicanus]|nr:hypothetical protein M0802_012130 [Mischocyttarus mexicanus]
MKVGYKPWEERITGPEAKQAELAERNVEETSEVRIHTASVSSREYSVLLATAHVTLLGPSGSRLQSYK